MKVNFVDLKEQYAGMPEDLGDRIAAQIKSGNFMGAGNFEKKFAKYHNMQHCVGVGSGTDALILALKAFGIGLGCDVIVPANTYIATAFAVSHVGATPIFVDPDPDTYVITAKSIKKAITRYTKAIIPVHLYGQPVLMDEIMEIADENELIVIEDCAQSTGASVNGKLTGTFGHAGCFSFYPTKNLGGLAQGGAVITNDTQAAITIRELGNVGRTDGSWFDYSYVGYNSRLDSVNATFLEDGLYMLDFWNRQRRIAATIYADLLSSVEEIKLPKLRTETVKPVYHLYEIKCQTKSKRDALKKFLEINNVGCGLHYPVPCHKQPVYLDMNFSCPITEELSDTLLSLPMHPYISTLEIEYVCNLIKEFFAS